MFCFLCLLGYVLILVFLLLFNYSAHINEDKYNKDDDEQQIEYLRKFKK